MRKHNQGQLDGLCGAYAVVNAVGHALNAPAQDSVRHLEHFQVALQSLPKRAFLEVIWNGTTVEQLTMMAKAVAKHISEETGKSTRLSVDQPMKRSQFQNLREYVEALGELQQRHVGLIVWIDWPESQGGAHWSVLKSVGPNKLSLLDSDGLTSFNRQSIAIAGNKTRLVPENTVRIMVRSVDGERINSLL